MHCTVVRRRSTTAYYPSHPAAYAAALVYIEHFISHHLIALSSASGTVVGISTFEISASVVGWLVVVSKQD